MKHTPVPTESTAWNTLAPTAPPTAIPSNNTDPSHAWEYERYNKVLQAATLLGGVTSMAACVLVMVSWCMYPRWRKHPARLIISLSLTDFAVRRSLDCATTSVSQAVIR